MSAQVGGGARQSFAVDLLISDYLRGSRSVEKIVDFVEVMQPIKLFAALRVHLTHFGQHVHVATEVPDCSAQ